MEWKDLNYSDKAQLMQLYLRNGITDLNEMRVHYNMFNNGGDIHIKESNKGKFTKSAQQAGMGVQEFARHVLANKDDYSSTQVKRANFARVFGGRHYVNGGSINYEG